MSISVKKTSDSNFIYDSLEHIGSINYKVGKRIESCRIIQGYTQAYLAKAVGITQEQMQRYE
ncbi:MAG: hypothetical protein ACR5KX_02200 [Wolbachia sp.]